MDFSRKIVLALGDFACFGIGFLLFALISPRFSNIGEAVISHGISFLAITLIWMLIFFIFNFYELRTAKPTLVFIRNLGFASLIMLAVGFIYFYIDPTTRITPKFNLVLFEGISLLLIILFRRVFYRITLQTFRTTFALICTDEHYSSIISEITEHPQLGLTNRGVFKNLADFSKANLSVDLLIVHNISETETNLLKKTLASNIEIIDLIEAYETIFYKIPVNVIDNAWIIHSIKKTSGIFYAIISRIISVTFAIVVGIITIPISLIIMMAIKIEDGGPVLYKNDRVGMYGKVFFLYKFRSMFLEAEKNGAVWAAPNDKRITRVGKIIRKLHIDEIPQLVNILKGDITLVGPRPERPDFVKKLEQEIPYYGMRHTIIPGFTGWAQIKFKYARSVIDSQEKFEYDLFYIKNRNIFLDLGIILKTVQIIFTH